MAFGDTGPVKGQVRRVACGHCYATYPKDQMKDWEGMALCASCHGLMERKTAAAAADDPPTEETQAFPMDTRILRLTEEAQARDRRPAPEPALGSDEEAARSRLMQLEYDRKRKPDDVPLLEELLALYQKLGHDDHVAEILQELKRVAPGTRKMNAKTTKIDRAATVRMGAIASTPFWDDLPWIFQYPFRGKSVIVTLGGGVVLGLIVWASARLVPFAALLAPPVMAVLVGFAFQVIRAAAEGIEDPPEWPDYHHPYNRYGAPLLAYGVCHTLALLPALTLAALLLLGIVPLGLGTAIGFSLVVVAGIFALPMSMLAFAKYDSLSEAMSPKIVFSAIGRVFPDYLILVGAFCIMSGGELLAIRFVGPLLALVVPDPMITGIASAVIVLTGIIYFLFVRSRMLGHLYFQAAGRIRWLGEAEEPQLSLSPGAAILGGGGIAFGAGVVLAVCFILPGAPLGALYSDDVALTDGSYLQYEVFDISAMGRTTVRYDIMARAEGFDVKETRTVRGMVTSSGTFSITPEGEFTAGTDGAGPVQREFYGPGTHTVIAGTRHPDMRELYVNEYRMMDHDTFKGYEVFTAEDRSQGGRLYYHRRTGVLVGGEINAGGRDHWFVLQATSVPGISVPLEARTAQ